MGSSAREHSRQHHLEEHEVAGPRVDLTQGIDAVASRRDPEAVALEATCQELAIAGVVVDHQDVRGLVRGRGRRGFVALRIGPRRRGLRLRQRRRAGIPLLAQPSVGEVEESARGVSDLLQIPSQIADAAVIELLLQQLGVAHDLADRGPHLVLQAAHGLPGPAQRFVAVRHGDSIPAPDGARRGRWSRSSVLRACNGSDVDSRINVPEFPLETELLDQRPRF
jgi:hypothetical protein